MTQKVLVVEDDTTLQDVLKFNLIREGYEVILATGGNQALNKAHQEHPDLIILDIMLPELSGLEVCRILRRESDMPIVMLTARDDEIDKVTGLDLGADDYLTKPFGMRELLARVRGLLRRQERHHTSSNSFTLGFGDVFLDAGKHTVMRSGKLLELTPKEFDLLIFLAQNKGLVFNREQLLEKVWGYDYGGDTRTVDVHVRWLRQKIEPDAANPRYLMTVRGTGYKLEV
jgi:DNA-binding response OmpR family regulator